MLKIIVPMSGEGRLFAERGYTFPKPLIEIAGRSMIEYIIQNVRPAEPHQFIFICKSDHLQQFALAEVLEQLAPGSAVVSVRNRTAGALCSVLLAKEHLLDETELLVVNGDQFVDAAMDAFVADARKRNLDGSILTFPATHPKWSYARLEGEFVTRVAEKRPISKNATVGWYYFRSTSAFLAAAETMILKNATVSGEFYVCPAYNELILRGLKIGVFPIERNQFHSLGNPEDVEVFAAEKARTLNW